MKESILQNKSFSFAILVVNLYKHLKLDKREFDLARQLLRAGTSIGANIEEALGGQSRKDFAAKIAIAYKEARETMYWLNLLKETNIISIKQYNEITPLLDEILRMLAKTQMTLRKNK